MRLDEQTVWVTGGASGIGRATALALARAGARVVVSDRDAAGLESVAAEAGDGVVDLEPLDVSRSEDVERSAAAILARHARLDALVSCAGINLPQRHLDELTAERWDAIVSVNLSGMYYCCHAVLPLMRANRGGTIVNIASWAARNLAYFPGAAYTASKRAALALTETINLEVGADGVRATVILPEAVDTPILARRPGGPPAPEARAKMLRPEDVADAIAWVLALPPHVCVNELQISPVANSFYEGLRPAGGSTMST
jgi:NAD(P)-dependent dehydrogenase (short-subunit alcohol dehydrogenase family)